MESSNNLLWTRERVSEFDNLTSGSVGVNRLPCKHNITHIIYLRVGLMQINELAMVCALFVNQNTSHLAKCGEMRSKIAGIVKRLLLTV